MWTAILTGFELVMLSGIAVGGFCRALLLGRIESQLQAILNERKWENSKLDTIGQRLRSIDHQLLNFTEGQVVTLKTSPREGGGDPLGGDGRRGFDGER